MPNSLRVIVALALVALTFAACDSTTPVGGSPKDGGPPPAQADAPLAATDADIGSTDAPMPATDGSIGGTDAPMPATDSGMAGSETASPAPDALPSPICRAFGQECATGADCCSTLCDPITRTCVASINKCTETGGGCASSVECCTLSCTAGRCSASACIADGNACADSAACCSGACTGGLCQPLSTTCRTAGNPCTQGSQCCSTLCQDGVCKLGASFCIQTGDVCGDGDMCCSGECRKGSGPLGTCAPPPSGATNCADGVDGTVCADCNGCCSRVCAPYAPSGVRVCQPASGCRVNGDLCRKDSDCCGAAGTGLPGEGNVTCEIEAGKALGICRNPRSCNPQGDVCHYKDYACSISSARNDCCGSPGNTGTCQLDTLGVPRCYGLDACRQAGETCSSAIDCCNQAPCVPDASGVLRCFVPPVSSIDGGVPSACVPPGGSCTINADCCVGSVCIELVGSTQGVCGTRPPPPGSLPVDGGTGPVDGASAVDGPAAVCAEYGQACTTSADCCNAVTCWNSRCMDMIVF
jgi:hypothetical protein